MAMTANTFTTLMPMFKEIYAKGKKKKKGEKSDYQWEMLRKVLRERKNV